MKIKKLANGRFEWICDTCKVKIQSDFIKHIKWQIHQHAAKHCKKLTEFMKAES